MSLDAPLTIEQRAGEVTILRLTGPLTLTNLFELQAMLRSGELPRITILDLTGVPYMDSAGMGLIINHWVHCQKEGVRLTIAGVSSRVMELFKLTKVDTIIPLTATVEEAEAV